MGFNSGLKGLNPLSTDTVLAVEV